MNWADILRMKLEIEEESREEDRLFHEWSAANCHRFPLVTMTDKTASNTQWLVPVPTKVQLNEFEAFRKQRRGA